MEKKYESDYSNKEKRKREWEKIKNLKGKERLSYLWDYYKWILVVLVFAIILANTGMTIYKNKNTNILLNLAVIDTAIDKDGPLKDLEKYLENTIAKKGKYNRVVIDTTGSSEESQAGLTKALVILTAETETDLVVCPKEFYERYEKQKAFDDWREFLGQNYDRYEVYMTDGILDLTKSKKWAKESYVYYSPVYLALVGNHSHKEGIMAFLDYYFPEGGEQ